MDKYLGKLSVVMPAFNEGAAIYDNIMEVSRSLETFAQEYEIIVVNDGSLDDTSAQTERAAKQDAHVQLIDIGKNAGKGHALCAGTEAATGDLIAFCDADLDINPIQLKTFIDIMQKTQSDVVIGSKMHPESNVDYPWHRRIISWGYYIFLLILFRLNVKDTQTGLKLFNADAIKPVMRQILVKRFAYDIEVLAILNSRGYKIASAPIEVVFQRGIYGSRIKLKDVFLTTWDTLAIFYRLNILRYYEKSKSSERKEK